MSSLKAKTIAGAKWTMIAQLFRTLVGIGMVAVLSRFLTPAEFGIVALILFVTQIMQTFNGFGMRIALIQRKTVTQLEMSSVFWTNIVFALVVTAACLALATPLAGLFDAPGMEAPLRWVTPIFLLSALRAVAMIDLERSLAFGRISAVSMISTVAGALVALVMVLNGARVSALIAQQLTIAGVNTLLALIISRWAPSLQFSFRALWPILTYGGYVAAGGMIYFAVGNATRPIIGGALSAAALGYFTVATQIVTSPLNVFVTAASRALLPALASIQDDDARLRKAHSQFLHALTLVMAPICLGIAAVSVPLVEVLLGPGWEVTATLLLFLSFNALWMALNRINTTIFVAKGYARFQFYWNIASSASTITVLILSLPYGIVGVVIAQTVWSGVLMTISSSFTLRFIKQPIGVLLRAIARPLLAAGAMALAVAATLERIALGPLPELVIGVAVGVVAYLGLVFLIDRQKALALVKLAIGPGMLPKFHSKAI